MGMTTVFSEPGNGGWVGGGAGLAVWLQAVRRRAVSKT
jgi:hypothetical protein